MYWYPQVLLQVASGEKTKCRLKKMIALVGVCKYVVFYQFGKTPNRCGTRFHAEKLSNFDLSSHPDLIDDQHDTQYLWIYMLIYLAYWVLYLNVKVPRRVPKSAL